MTPVVHFDRIGQTEKRLTEPNLLLPSVMLAVGFSTLANELPTFPPLVPLCCGHCGPASTPKSAAGLRQSPARLLDV